MIALEAAELALSNIRIGGVTVPNPSQRGPRGSRLDPSVDENGNDVPIEQPGVGWRSSAFRVVTMIAGNRRQVATGCPSPSSESP